MSGVAMLSPACRDGLRAIPDPGLQGCLVLPEEPVLRPQQPGEQCCCSSVPGGAAGPAPPPWGRVMRAQPCSRLMPRADGHPLPRAAGLGAATTRLAAAGTRRPSARLKRPLPAVPLGTSGVSRKGCKPVPRATRPGPASTPSPLDARASPLLWGLLLLALAPQAANGAKDSTRVRPGAHLYRYRKLLHDRWRVQFEARSDRPRPAQSCLETEVKTTGVRCAGQ